LQEIEKNGLVGKDFHMKKQFIHIPIFPTKADFRLAMPDYAFSYNANSCVILSKFEMVEMFARRTRIQPGRFLRFVTGQIQVPGSKVPLYVTCLHLGK